MRLILRDSKSVECLLWILPGPKLQAAGKKMNERINQITASNINRTLFQPQGKVFTPAWF